MRAIIAAVALAGRRMNAVNDTTHELNRTEEVTFACEIADEELEAVAEDATMRMWTRLTTSCGGPSPGPGCG
jgi:hypothetical protein